MIRCLNSGNSKLGFLFIGSMALRGNLGELGVPNHHRRHTLLIKFRCFQLYSKIGMRMSEEAESKAFYKQSLSGQRLF